MFVLFIVGCFTLCARVDQLAEASPPDDVPQPSTRHFTSLQFFRQN
jgi:hypothetical protein